MATTATAVPSPPHSDAAVAGRLLRALVGPAALTAAGMIGAGAVATRLLAGAWFGFDLLWVALYVIPMVIFTLDSASRVGDALGRPRHVRHDPHATSARGSPGRSSCRPSLVNVIVNMSQMSAMVEGTYGALGLLPPAGGDRAAWSSPRSSLTAVTRRRRPCSAATSASRRS